MAAGPAVVELGTFRGYLEKVVAVVASFLAVLLLLRLDCLLVFRLDLRGRCLGSGEGSN